MANTKFDAEWQILRIKDFSGGWAARPKDIKESEQFENLEVTREKWARTVIGSVKINSSDLGDHVASLITGRVNGTDGAAIMAYIIQNSGPNKMYAGVGQGIPFTFTDITGAASFSGLYWSGTNFVNTSGEKVILISNDSDGVWVWDNSGNIANVAGAPVVAGDYPKLLANYQGHVFAVIAPNKLYFSEYLDYTSWPGENLIELSMENGEITGLATMPDKLLIYFKEGSAMINGQTQDDFSDSFTILSCGSGSAYSSSISTYGSEVGMNTTAGPIIIDATGVVGEYIAEPLREMFLELADPETYGFYSWDGVLTPFHYVLYQRASSLNDPGRLFVYDRGHKAWSEFVTPSSTVINSIAAPGFLATDASADYSAVSFPIIYGCADGNIYAIESTTLSGNNLNGDDATWATAAGMDQVTCIWRSKEINFGSDNILKTFRNLKILMTGANVTVRLYYKIADGTTSIDTYTGNSIPMDKDGFFLISNNYRLCRSIKIEIEGDNLEIREVSIFYRPKRMR